MIALRGAASLAGMLSTLIGAVIDLNGKPHYVHSGWFLISVANLVVIAVMVVLFALALVVPFPHGRKPE